MQNFFNMNTILVIEDDLQLRDMLVYFLTDIEGYDVLTLTSGEGAVEKILETKPSLVLLDVQLPHTNGLRILSGLRAKNVSIPVIMMTANDNELTETNALSLGADDYITKPIRTAALRERIKRQLLKKIHNNEITPSPSVEADPLEVVIYAKRQRLVYGQKIMKLLPSDIEVLMSLVEGDAPKPIGEIFYDIHGFQAPVDDRSVYMRISSLRKRISSHWPDLELINNHRSKGFFLTQKLILK